MSTELKEIKQRIGSTRQIQRVTSTLQRVAAARLARDRRLIENARRYRDELLAALQAVRAAAPEAGHPLMVSRESGAACLVVFGADRGLCGGFTTNLMEEVNRFVGAPERASRPTRLVAMGKVVAHRARRTGFAVDHAFRQAAVSYTAPEAGVAGQPLPGADDIERMTAWIIASFLDGTLGEVHVLYSEFVSSLRQKPTVARLLPVTASAQSRPRFHSARLEPTAERLLAKLVPEYVGQFMYAAFVNSLGSENASRQIAMNRATENASDLLEELVIEFRRTRQDSITAEMLALFGGEGSQKE